MEYIRFGSTGMEVSKICFGTMMFAMEKGWRNYALGKKDAAPVFKYALESGINFFDTADMYSNGSCEEVTGELLNEMAKRDEIVLATKVYAPMGDGPNQKGLSRKYIFNAIDASLSRLKMDYVDLYIIHRWDYNTSIEETMEALHDVVKSGKARYIGASSMHAWQLAKAQEVAKINGWTQFVSMQNHYNLIYREEEREMMPLCIYDKLAVTPWSPLARGFLAGNRNEKGKGKTDRSKNDVLADNYYYNDNDFKTLKEVIKIAKSEKRHPVEIALAWLMQKPGVTAPIIGPGKLEQLEVLINSLNLKLSERQIQKLEKHYKPKIISGHF